MLCLFQKDIPYSNPLFCYNEDAKRDCDQHPLNDSYPFKRRWQVLLIEKITGLASLTVIFLRFLRFRLPFGRAERDLIITRHTVAKSDGSLSLSYKEKRRKKQLKITSLTCANFF